MALVIFAFGLLAAAALVLSSLRADKYNSNSVMATAMAREYGDLMQLFPDAIAPTAGAAAGAQGTLLVDTSTVNGTNASLCTGANKTCTPAQMVSSVASDWSARVKADLPDGRANVCRDSSPRTAGELTWATAACDGAGDTVLVMMGWLGQKNVSWEVADRPRFALSMMGTLRDYVAH